MLKAESGICGMMRALGELSMGMHSSCISSAGYSSVLSALKIRFNANLIPNCLSNLSLQKNIFLIPLDPFLQKNQHRA